MERIVILGASPDQDALICKAKSMGLETHAFAWQNGEPGESSADYYYPISIRNKESILQECRRIKPRAIVSGASDLTMNVACYIAEELKLPCNAYKTVQQICNKLALRQILTTAGLPQPAFLEIGDQMPAESLTNLRYPVVVKPSDRSGGRGVVLVNNERALRYYAAEARDISFEHRAIVEEYIPGTYYSVETISHQGNHWVLAITESEIFQMDDIFLEAAHNQPAKMSGKTSKQLEETACAALDALGFCVGAAHVEFVVASDGTAYIIEISPGMGGDFIGSDLVGVSSGLDYLRMIIDCARGKAPEIVSGAQKLDAHIRFITCAEDLECWNKDRLARGNTVIRSQIPGDGEDLPLQRGKRRYGYYIAACRPKEMGGYLPLELSHGQEFFQDFSANKIRRLNCGRTAFWYAIRTSSLKRVFVPHFCTPGIAQAIQEAGAQVEYYSIDKNFLPVDLHPTQQDGVVLVNYYGLMDETLSRYVQGHPDQSILIDNAASFFCRPILRRGVYNIYSCRKFIGVPDGAYLIGMELPELELEEDYSAGRAGFLLHSIEQGTGGAYQMNLRNEREMGQKKARMSELTRCLLDGVDYARIRETRRENYRCLHRLLGEKNLLKLELGDCVPQYYPFMGDGELREQLLRQRVYLPMLWRKCLSPEFDGSIEQLYSSHVCCLPIDQRYRAEDMRELAQILLTLCK